MIYYSHSAMVADETKKEQDMRFQELFEMFHIHLQVSGPPHPFSPSLCNYRVVPIPTVC